MADKRDTGNQGERFAAEQLAGMGYTILARNARCRYGEIDIIAAKDGYLCFVEVKTRGNAWLSHGAYAVDRAKQRRIIRAALDWMQRFPQQDSQPRFDVFLVGVDRKGGVCRYEYLEGAFDGEAYTGSARD